MDDPITSVRVAKLLLRGRLAQVQELRRRHAAEFAGLPDGLRTIANAWTGRGRGDGEGRRQLQRLLQEQTP